MTVHFNDLYYSFITNINNKPHQTTLKMHQIANVYRNLVRNSFENAENNISKINNEILAMDGMSGTKTRHFYNNLLSYEDARYLEVGTWKGSSVCSAMCGNNATVTCVDNWSEFNGPKEEFLQNFNKFKGNNNAKFIENDCFSVDVNMLNKINIFLYDGEHSEESQYKSLFHFYNCLDDVFIFIVDDWNWKRVRDGTKNAINDLNLTVLYEKEIILTNNDEHTRIDIARVTWWNGIYVAVLQKNN